MKYLYVLICMMTAVIFTAPQVPAGVVLYSYDDAGNLGTAEYLDGTIIAYQYDSIGNRVKQTVTVPQQDFVLHAGTGNDRPLSGLAVDVFHEDGSLTGINAVTNEQGKAIFDTSVFQNGVYRFRILYLNQAYWSDPVGIPSSNEAWIIVHETSVTVTLTAAGETISGVTVSVYDEAGTFLGIYGTTGEDGTISFVLPENGVFKFQTDYFGNDYWSQTIETTPGDPIRTTLDTGGGTATVLARKDTGTPLEGLDLYLYSATGVYLDQHGITDASGLFAVNLPAGEYQISTDYLGCTFGTGTIEVSSDTSFTLEIPHKDVTITVQGDFSGDIRPMADVPVELLSPSGTDFGISQLTDTLGTAVFNLPECGFTALVEVFSIDYRTGVFSWTDETITIPEGEVNVVVSGGTLPRENVPVTVFSASMEELPISGTTDSQGRIKFRLPEGSYSFRAFYQGSYYWSGVTPVVSHTVNPVAISTGGGRVALTVLKDTETPIENAVCRIHDESGNDLGITGLTSSSGRTFFDLPDGTHNIKIDTMGYSFWTGIFTVPDTLDLVHIIPHSTVDITVQGNYSGDIEVKATIALCLFTASGSQPEWTGTTDSSGKASLYLPEREYILRAEYLSRYYWSAPFTGSDVTLSIEEGIAQVILRRQAKPIDGAPVTVFSSDGDALGIAGRTGPDGMVAFRLPDDTYRFRGDYLNKSYWATQEIKAHTETSVIINTDTTVTHPVLTVENDLGSPLKAIPVSLYDSLGTATGISGFTDNQGRFAFDAADGDYRLKVDYLGHEFWTKILSLPDSGPISLVIPHRDVTIAVSRLYGTNQEPLGKMDVEIHAPGDSGGQLSAKTDKNGQVSFSLPDKEYAATTRYYGNDYWSDTFIWENQSIAIDHGMATLHITINGQDARKKFKVYLCDTSGVYLNEWKHTDKNGYANFTLPAGNYTFFTDNNHVRYWSGTVPVTAHGAIIVEMPLE